VDAQRPGWPQGGLADAFRSLGRPAAPVAPVGRAVVLAGRWPLLHPTTADLQAALHRSTVLSSARDVASGPLILVLLVLVTICWPSHEASTTVSLARPTPGDVAAVLLVGWLLVRLTRPDGPAQLRSGWLAPVVAVAATAGISVFVATAPVLALAGYARLLEIFVLVPVAVVVAVGRLADALALAAAILAVGAVQAAVGIAQFRTGTGAGFGASSVRAVGTFGAGDAVAMGNIMATTAVILVAALLCFRGRLRAAAALGLPLAVIPLAMSLTRGAILAFAFSLVVVGAASRWQHLLGLATVVLVAGSVLFAVGGAGGTVAGRLTSIASAGSSPDQSVADRYQLWQLALDVWRTDPVRGVGIKNFAAYRDTYAPLGLSSGGDVASGHSYVRVQLLSSHNEYLLILAEQGLPGLAAYLSLMLALLAAPTRLRRQRPPAARFLGLATLGIGVQLCLIGLYGELSGPSALFGAVCIGLCLAAGRLGTAGSGDPR
jgi:O-antigen ligase